MNENTLPLITPLFELISIPCFLEINSSIFYFFNVCFWVLSFLSWATKRLLLLDWFSLD